jgi:hypothetical protein
MPITDFISLLHLPSVAADRASVSIEEKVGHGPIVEFRGNQDGERRVSMVTEIVHRFHFRTSGFT